jgi:transposase InsO family protein
MGRRRAAGLARYVVDAVLLEGASAREVAQAHGISKSWIYELIGRYREGGYEALEPRSRRPCSCKHQTPGTVVQAIIALRERLASEGHDCGPATIAYHLAHETAAERVPSVCTIWRILRREGLIVSQPQKRPRSSLIRFQAELPNEMWQADVTRWRLADGTEVEILNMIDDHSRLFLASQAHPTVKAHDVVEVFHKAAQLHGLPAWLLTDNGAVFTGFSRKGKVLLESELERLGIEFKNSRPYHPQTCGKIERLHQTLKRYLARQRAARTIGQLQAQLDAFAHYYNTMRPHRALQGRTPLQAYSTRIKARSANQTTAPQTHFRVRQDKVDQNGKVTVRYQSRLHHIGIGRAPKAAPSSSSSPTETSASSIQKPASYYAPSRSTPAATTSPSTKPKSLHNVPRHPSRMSRDTTDGGGGIRTLVGGLTPEMVFETTAFNRSATPPGRNRG